MRITAVEIQGLLGRPTERVELAPVSVFHGPNGSGKTTIVGAIVYALTGRFPGVVGVKSDAILPLATDPSEGFRVILDARSATETIQLTRSQAAKHTATMAVGGKYLRAAADVKAAIAKHFGDVDWLVDAFDPEASFWRLSPEKRSRWMFELCAGASGWTMDRVVTELGGPSPDWNVHIGRDASASVELNIAQLDDRLLAAQRVVRESSTIADGIAAPTEPPSPEALAAAEEAVRATAADGERARGALVQAKAAGDARVARLAQIDADILAIDIASGLPAEICPTCGGPLHKTRADELRRAAVAKRDALETERTAVLAEPRASTKSQSLGDAMDSAVAAHASAQQALGRLRQADGVARERKGQLAAATAAEARVGALKHLLSRARDVRTAMLRDSVEPLRKALGKLTTLAPRGMWSIQSDGSFRLRRTDGALVGISAMSAGERYRATIALLVATSMIRREPWVGLFLDAFEQVSGDVRESVLSALVEAQRAGHVDNVFVAGAFEPGPPVAGAITYYARSAP